MNLILQKISDGVSLSENEINEATEYLFTNEITDSEIAALLIGLKTKGETVEEIVGLAKALRGKSLTFNKKIPNVMDNCGTGGDGSKSFNISTTSAFVLAGAGISVAKHGNRSVSSKTGSADVLEHLGIHLSLGAERTEEILETVGIAFLYAPNVHPQLKRILKVRKELRIPTVFNLIGPLTNPVELETQLLGIYRRDYLVLFAEVLKKLGRKRAVVLNGAGHMDEASLQGENHLVILENESITEKILHPEELGLPVYSNDSIRGGNAKENSEILLKVLKGQEGAYRDTVLLNAGIGIFTAGKAESIQKGVELAKESIDSGSALNKLEQLIKESKTVQEQVI
ncbi:anthranilate phosphoribosyltransferase [Cytobacillus depressus]|uniref:Anthranilate phosphoribosyltransferase n=1 Tax=Cytobacillus depressus TaxID=1602942 RepID=A0A6L3V8V1_9BACI|nr:anthranilate phosphoribosyltransferase [Cytobacillus depressus]KAB2338106.1 anthranilate phosphoribosyltransferase [Cytobacillus depressus]